MDEIYIITSIHKGGKPARPWFWFRTEQEAKESVESDKDGYYEERLYDYIVIEKFPYEGQIGEQIQWYKSKLDDKTRKFLEWEEIECPESFNNIIN